MFNQSPMYNPFMGLGSTATRGGLLSGLLRGGAKGAINWGTLLSNTQKTLGIINQAIPVFYQVKPIWNNARTVFRVLGEMGRMNNNTTNSNVVNNNNSRNSTEAQSINSTTASNSSQQQSTTENNGPQFFI